VHGGVATAPLLLQKKMKIRRML